MSRMKRHEESLWHDEALGTDCPCPVCVEMADVHNAAMSDEEGHREICYDESGRLDCSLRCRRGPNGGQRGEPVSREEARKWLARCRATLTGATLSSKLVSSREKEEKW